MEGWHPRTNAFCDFSIPSVSSIAPATKKVRPGHTKCCTCHLMLQTATALRISAPGPSNIYDPCVSCISPATRNASLHILFKSPTPANVVETVTKPPRFAHFWQGAESLAPATQTTLQRPKAAQTCGILGVLTSKCASRHNGVQSAPAALASLLFGPQGSSGATNYWKNIVFRSLFTFSRACLHLLFSDSFSSVIFFLLFHLCFSIFPYRRKFDV